MKEENYKQMYTWKTSLKTGAGIALGFAGVFGLLLFFFDGCKSNSNGAQREIAMDRMQTFINQSSKEELVISGVVADDYFTFMDDSIGIYKKDGVFGYYNRNTKKIVISATYEDAERFSQGVAGVVKNGKVGFINQEGETVIGFNYAYKKNFWQKSFFQWGYCAVPDAEGKHYGVIDRKGEWVIKPIYTMATVVSCNYAVVSVANGFKMQVDYSGKVLNRFVVDEVEVLSFSTGGENGTIIETKNYQYKVNGQAGLMDGNGNILTQPIYKEINAVGKNLFQATLHDDASAVLIDEKGELVNR